MEAVYLVRMDRFYKIGRTRHLERRIARLEEDADTDQIRPVPGSEEDESKPARKPTPQPA